MHFTRRATFGFATAFGLACLGSVAQAQDTTITVSLWDKGDTAMDMVMDMAPMGMAMGADMTMVTMGVTIDKATVPAGPVTFDVTNASTWAIHEMVISPVADQTQPLPYVVDEMKVDEDAAGHLAEVAELDPEGKGSLTITMDPGTYILYCNIPGHYAMGMWTILTVTE